MDALTQPLDDDLQTLWARVDEAGPLADASDLDALAALDPDWAERAHARSDRRRTFIALYAWATPTRETIEAIAAFVGEETLLEVCAGSGLWARLLAGAGSRVIATDAGEQRQTYVPVEALEAEQAVRAHPACRALLLCWPPFRDDCAARALRAFAGDRVILIGDARFVADQRFHEHLRRDWTLQASLPLPSWPGLDDCARLYLRQPAAVHDVR